MRSLSVFLRERKGQKAAIMSRGIDMPLTHKTTPLIVHAWLCRLRGRQHAKSSAAAAAVAGSAAGRGPGNPWLEAAMWASSTGQQSHGRVAGENT